MKLVYLSTITVRHWIGTVNKHYLHSLQLNGIDIIPTVFINKGSNVFLKDLMMTNYWTSVVIKSCVCADTYETHILRYAKETGPFQQKLEHLVSQRDMRLINIYLQWDHMVSGLWYLLTNISAMWCLSNR